MRIDYLLMQPDLLEVVETKRLPRLDCGNPIPNLEHPSDHLPLVMTFKVKPELSTVYRYSSEWVKGVLQAEIEGSYTPLSVLDLHMAFEFFDESADGEVSLSELRQCLNELGYEYYAKKIEEIVVRELTAAEAEAEADAAELEAASGSGRASIAASSGASRTDMTNTSLSSSASLVDGSGHWAMRPSLASAPPALSRIAAANASSGEVVQTPQRERWDPCKPLSVREFILVYVRTFTSRAQGMADDLAEAFAYFDADGDGKLTKVKAAAWSRGRLPCVRSPHCLVTPELL